MKTRISVTAIIVAALATSAATFNATWTFLPGGAIGAINVNSVFVEVAESGASITCTHSAAQSVAQSGSGLSGADLVALNSIDLTTPANPAGACDGPGGVYVNVTPKGLPWKFQAGSYDPANGEVRGRMTGILIAAEISDGCRAEFAAPNGGPGEVELSYRPTGRLTMGLGGEQNSNLVVKSTNGLCDPLMIEVGNGINVTATYKTIGGAPPVVTSP